MARFPLSKFVPGLGKGITVQREDQEVYELQPFAIPIRNWMAEDGAVLTIAEEAGTFFVQDGTNQMYLQGEEAAMETEASVIKSEITLPANYKAGGAVTVRFGTDVTGAGTLGTCTIDLTAFKQAVDGSVGSDLCATAAQAISATAGDKDFTITPTGLVAGDRLNLIVTVSVEETMNTAIRALITRTLVLCDIQG